MWGMLEQWARFKTVVSPVDYLIVLKVLHC